MRRLAMCLAMLAAPSFAGHTLTPKQKVVIDAWLARHTEYRRAVDADCECGEFLQMMRTGDSLPKTALPGYHPYVATGDFNHDGQVDFAVVVVNREKTVEKFALLIFNGPYGEETTEPSYFKAGLDLKGEGLTFGPGGSPSNILLLGRFYSDFMVLLVPKGGTYTMKE